MRVAAGNPYEALTSPTYAVAFVDLRCDDGHVERWFGAGALHPERRPDSDSLVAWGEDVAEEHGPSPVADLRQAFAEFDNASIENAPSEESVEWNAVLPDL